MNKGLVYNIQRLSLQDGPGIRTTVFFKGCPLSCLWCSNPESQSPEPQLLVFQDLCQKCGRCVQICPHGAISMNGDGGPIQDRGRCRACGLCVPVCPHEARSLSGRSMTVEEVLAVVRKDWIHYQNSGGGLTVGGGEPCYQPAFLKALLQAAHAEGLHTCLDTSGYTPWKNLEQVLPYLDLILYDCKHLDGVQHRRLTGVDNGLILENLTRLARNEVPIRVRMPFIPGYNSSPENLMALGQFVGNLGLKDLDIIPYHKFGLNKYRALGREYLAEDFRTSHDLAEAVQLLESFSVKVSVI